MNKDSRGKNCFILIQWFRWEFEPLTLKFVFPRLKQCQASASGFDKMVGANSVKGFTCVHGRTLKSLEKPQIVKNLGFGFGRLRLKSRWNVWHFPSGHIWSIFLQLYLTNWGAQLHNKNPFEPFFWCCEICVHTSPEDLMPFQLETFWPPGTGRILRSSCLRKRAKKYPKSWPIKRWYLYTLPESNSSWNTPQTGPKSKRSSESPKHPKFQVLC